ncbi:hypothetical protein ACFP56_11195 [Paenibacillus septentrionalis]|uniref:Uncharacterized protein n=1 Tax=Paenibacillus septentrionalis TaxID=429342 RepID=A0ABW1V616_9BACL
MSNVLPIDKQTLAQAWQETLPTFLNTADECNVQPDAKFDDTLLIHIANNGRSHYSADFRLSYVDQREVKVELLDVEKGNAAADDHTIAAQNLVEDYVRNIHECAQSLKGLTNQ